MSQLPPPGQGPIDPRGAFTPPPPPSGAPPRSYPGQGYQPPMPPPPGAFMPPPPGWFPPPPKQPRSGGFARAIFTTLATTIFGISLALNLYLLLANGLMSGKSTRETVITEGDMKQKVVIVPIVNSMMLEAQAAQLDKMLDAAEKDSSVKAVVLKIDTPGGEVTAADEMYHRIETFKTNRPGVPVIISMGGTCASGGYYAACAGEYIFAQPTTITGSIGVLLPQYNISKLAEKYGVQDTSLHATGTPYKTAGSWMKPPSEDEDKYLINLIDAAFKNFKAVVTNGRQGRLKQPLETIANGKAYTADEGVTLGLVDQIGYPADACAYAMTKVGVKNMAVVQYEQPATLVELFSSSKSGIAPSQANGGVQINGVNVDMKQISELVTPRMMYMWQGD